MMAFLAQKGIDEDHRGQIVDELFSKCDANNDGDVQIKEFVDYYIITKNELVKRKQELTAQILDNNKVVTSLKAQLVTLRLNATRLIQQKSATQLNLRINSAEGFGYQTQAVMVVVSHLGDQKTSSRQAGPIAQWIGESLAIQIMDERSPITIGLRDANSGKDLMNVSYTLNQLKMNASTVETRIQQANGGPFVMARFEVADNDI